MVKIINKIVRVVRDVRREVQQTPTRLPAETGLGWDARGRHPRLVGAGGELPVCAGSFEQSASRLYGCAGLVSRTVTNRPPKAGREAVEDAPRPRAGRRLCRRAVVTARDGAGDWTCDMHESGNRGRPQGADTTRDSVARPDSGIKKEEGGQKEVEAGTDWEIKHRGTGVYGTLLTPARGGAIQRCRRGFHSTVAPYRALDEGKV